LKIILKEKSEDTKNRNSYLIKLENEEEFFISDEDYFSNQIYGMDEIEPSVLLNLSRNLIIKKAKSYAIKFVMLKIRSSGEVRTKLSQQGYDEEVIEATLEYLVESNYINDENFARVYSNHLIKTKRLSQNQIKYELKRKGIDLELVEDILSDDSISDISTAQNAFRKKYKNFDFSDVKMKAKAQNFLMSKGFSYDIIKQVFEGEENR